MIPFPNRLTTGLAALAACILFASCNSTKSPMYSDNGVVDYTSSNTRSPTTRLSKEEYPFDEDGNYREDWAARGAGVSGVKDTPTVRNTAPVRDTPTDTALYTQAADGTTSRGPASHPAFADYDTPPETTTFTSSSQGGGTYKPVVRRSTSSSGSRSTASNRSSGSKSKSKSTASKSKSKPKPKSSPATVVKVKSSDTLYGLSKKYGVSVASIKSANGLKSDLIRDGKSLKIPRKK